MLTVFLAVLVFVLILVINCNKTLFFIIAQLLYRFESYSFNFLVNEVADFVFSRYNLFRKIDLNLNFDKREAFIKYNSKVVYIEA